MSILSTDYYNLANQLVTKNRQALTNLLQAIIQSYVSFINKQKQEPSSPELYNNSQEILTFLSLYSQLQKIQYKKYHILVYQLEIDLVRNQLNDHIQNGDFNQLNFRKELTNLKRKLQGVPMDNKEWLEIIEICEEIIKDSIKIHRLLDRTIQIHNSLEKVWLSDQVSN